MDTGVIETTVVPIDRSHSPPSAGVVSMPPILPATPSSHARRGQPQQQQRVGDAGSVVLPDVRSPPGTTPGGRSRLNTPGATPGLRFSRPPSGAVDDRLAATPPQWDPAGTTPSQAFDALPRLPRSGSRGGTGDGGAGTGSRGGGGNGGVRFQGLWSGPDGGADSGPVAEGFVSAGTTMQRPTSRISKAELMSVLGSPTSQAGSDGDSDAWSSTDGGISADEAGANAAQLLLRGASAGGTVGGRGGVLAPEPLPRGPTAARVGAGGRVNTELEALARGAASSGGDAGTPRRVGDLQGSDAGGRESADGSPVPLHIVTTALGGSPKSRAGKARGGSSGAGSESRWEQPLRTPHTAISLLSDTSDDYAAFASQMGSPQRSLRPTPGPASGASRFFP